MEVKRFIYNEIELREKAFEIRKEVFIEEQNVSERDEFDEFESSSIHYLVFKNGEAIGTSRWRFSEKGIKFERFAVLNQNRRSGVGMALMKKMLNDVPEHVEIYLHAQVAVIDFYSKLGFSKIGEMFSECNIDHYKMTLNRTKKSLSLQDSIDCVVAFHKAFKIPHTDQLTAEVDSELIELRHRLMHEENEEYLEAAKEGDLVEIADALGDMLYILCGTIITHGMQGKIEEVYREIQRSNMSKLDKWGNPIYREDGKVMKSDQYFKPNISEILENAN